MQVRRDDSGLFIVSLTRGELIREKVEAVAVKEKIFGAVVSAIGVVENPELGFYKRARQEHIRKSFPGEWKLISLLGNISLKEGKPFLHANASISDNYFNVVGGYFFDARVAVVVEMFITRLGELRRVYREDLDLHCWELNV